MEAEEFQQALPVGTILKSPKFDYRVEEVLGKGGFGITYKVSTTVVFNNVPIFTYFAVKEHFLKDACERSGSAEVCYSKPLAKKVEESRGDFLSEARRLNAISGENPNVVPVNEVFEANNTVYYVMEYLNGGSLRDSVFRHGALSESAALEIIRPIAESVAFLHGHMINHLDIKPDNIMFRTDRHSGKSVPVLIDFGLAKHFDEKGKPTSTIRMQGCSDGYAPVEQYSGLSSFSPQADVYALGATLYYMLVGKAPVIATELQADTVVKALPETVSPSLRTAVVKAMAYNKFDRTASASEFLAALDASAAEGEDKDKDTVKKEDTSGTVPKERTSETGGSSTTVVIGGGNGRSRSLKKKLRIGAICILAVAAALILWTEQARILGFFEGGSSDSDLREEADEHYDDYKSACMICDSIMWNADSGDWESLLEAKSMLAEIVETEDMYAGENPDCDYDLSGRLTSDLQSKLDEAHDAWVKAAEVQETELGDYSQALEYYKIAYRLKEAPETYDAISRLENGD